MAQNLRAELQGFRKTCLDSLAHALAHYGELSFEGGRFHDRKWAVLSVAHAAEIYCNLLLTVLDPRHPCGGRYPSLSAAVQHLQEHTESGRLSLGEMHVVRDVLPSLTKLRNKLMHRPAPERLEMGDATVALLALLYLSKRRFKVSASDLLNQDPPIETDVIGELRAREQERWFIVAEQLVLEDYGDQHVEHCDSCGRFALTPDFGCQACFAEW